MSGNRYDGNDRYDRNGEGDDDEEYEGDYDVHHLAIESESSVAARRRRRKAMITFGVGLLGLFFVFWWAYSYYKAATPGASAPVSSSAASCRPTDPKAMTPAKVTVNVFNSTTRKGLAASAAKEFQSQGYVVAKVANDPTKKAVSAPAEVRFGPTGKAAADLVLKSLGAGAVSVPDTRTDAGVDVALGTAYVALKPLPTPSSTLPDCPATSKSPAASGSSSPAAQ